MFSIVNSAVNIILPAFADERRTAAPGCGAAAARRAALSIDIFCAYGAQQQTRRKPLLHLTDGQTDGWMGGHRPFYRPCAAYYAHNVKKRVQLSNRQCSASLNFLRRHWVHCILIDGPYSNFTRSFHVSQRRPSDATI